jgi:hypothetical protein
MRPVKPGFPADLRLLSSPPAGTDRCAAWRTAGSPVGRVRGPGRLGGAVASTSRRNEDETGARGAAGTPSRGCDRSGAATYRAVSVRSSKHPPCPPAIVGKCDGVFVEPGRVSQPARPVQLAAHIFVRNERSRRADRHVIDLMLGHAPQDKTGAAYNRALDTAINGVVSVAATVNRIRLPHRSTASPPRIHQHPAKHAKLNNVTAARYSPGAAGLPVALISAPTTTGVTPPNTSCAST